MKFQVGDKTKIAPIAAKVGDIVNHAGADEEVLEVEINDWPGRKYIRLRVQYLATGGIYDFYFDGHDRLTLIRAR